MSEKVKLCKICGKQIKESRGRRLYCSETCAKTADKQRAKKRQELIKGACKVKARKPPQKPKLTSAQIEERARAEGLSYGKYVAKYGL